MNKIKSLMLVLAAAMLVSAIGCTSNGDAAPGTVSWNSKPDMQIDVTKSYKAVFDTSMGSFEIELWAADAPLTVNNFVFLARQGYYNGTYFHRILKEFAIQGGNRGQYSPGYQFADELPAKYPYEPGIVAMANTGYPHTNGSQFFICTGYQSSTLDNNPTYTQFGRVTSGMDVVRKIASVTVVMNSNGSEMSLPINPPKVNKVTIIES